MWRGAEAHFGYGTQRKIVVRRRGYFIRVNQKVDLTCYLYKDLLIFTNFIKLNYHPLLSSRKMESLFNYKICRNLIKLIILTILLNFEL